MEGKLIRRHDKDYKLYVNGEPFAQVIDSPYKKLSLKNCQAIENGYDLDELAKERIVANSVNGVNIDLLLHHAFKLGAKAILELLGDKKFSEDDMRNLYNYMETRAVNFLDDEEPQIAPFSDYTQSLQPKEWDVIIEMESNLHIGEVVDKSYPKDFPTEKPKRDSNGCLILKRI